MSQAAHYRLNVPCYLWTVNGERKISRYKRAEYVRATRKRAKIEAREDLLTWKVEPFTAPVEVWFQPRQHKGTLADAAGHVPPCKAVLDGIVDAGILAGDGPEHVVRKVYYHPIRDITWAGIQVVIREFLPE